MDGRTYDLARQARESPSQIDEAKATVCAKFDTPDLVDRTDQQEQPKREQR